MTFGDFSIAPVVDAASEITARLHLYRRNLLLGPATGFFKKLNNQVFLITNWHVVMGRHQETKQVLHSKAAIPRRPSLHCSSDSCSHSDSSILWARTRSPHRLMSLLRGQWRRCAPLSSACAKTVALTKNEPSPFEDGFRQQIINYS